MSISRREYIKLCLVSLALYPGKPLLALTSKTQAQTGNGNFHYIYTNPELRDRFFHFYENVFHLYPEKELHQLIGALTKQHKTDKAVYQALQASLEQRLAELERMAQDAQIARNIAEAARLEAEAGAEDAQATIRRLMREAGENETVSLEMACLNTTVPADAISGLR